MLDICLYRDCSTEIRDCPSAERFLWDRVSYSRQAGVLFRRNGILCRHSLPETDISFARSSHLHQSAVTQLEYSQNIVELSMHVPDHHHRPLQVHQVTLLNQNLIQLQTHLPNYPLSHKLPLLQHLHHFLIVHQQIYKLLQDYYFYKQLDSFNIEGNKMKKKMIIDNSEESYEHVGKKVKVDLNYLTGKPYSERYYKILETRKKLPAYQSKPKLITLLQEYQVIILVGETGSGKTTQIPQFLIEHGYATKHKGIACTQPRRVAAMSVAKRVSQQLDVELGQQVGYSIRFEDLTSKKTIIKYMTDGMLLRQAMLDPNLQRYSVIILDEAHQRTLNTDVLFGLIKEIIARRTDIKLIVMSATMDAIKFQQYFQGSPRLNIPGRMFPVDVYYSKEPQTDYVQAAIRTAVTIHSNEPEGDILIFLTGQQEIQTACAKILQEIKSSGDTVAPVAVIPLYSTLPPYQQQRIFQQPPKPNKKGLKGRKIIVATNIAETSITIDGIVYVIDPGFSKQKVFNPRMRVESLLVSPISKASAKQRAGRAGRTRPGKCFRLYTQKSYNEELIENTYPQILRSNLATTVLTLKKLGINDLVHFDFMDPPAPETLMRALQLLNYLGALDDEGNLTPQGQKMAQFPLEPQLSKILLSSAKYNCSNQILTIVACLNSPNMFLRPKDKMQEANQAHAKFISQEGDHMTIMNTFFQYKRKNQDVDWCYNNYLNNRSLKSAFDVRQQLKTIFEKFNVAVKDEVPLKMNPIPIKKCILTGYFTQVAVLQKNNVYMTVKDSQVVIIHPSSILTYRPEYVVYNELVLTKKNYMRTVMQIKPSWLFEIAPLYFKPQTIKNIQTRKALAQVQKAFIESLTKKKQ